MKPNRSELPLTRFIGMLWCYTDDQVRQACADRAAKHYGINPKHAAGYIRMERELRGVG